MYKQAQYITRLQNWDYIIVSAPEVDHRITEESLWPEDETSTLNHKKSFGLITQNNFKKKFLLLLIVNDCKQLNATLKKVLGQKHLMAVFMSWTELHKFFLYVFWNKSYLDYIQKQYWSKNLNLWVSSKMLLVRFIALSWKI